MTRLLKKYCSDRRQLGAECSSGRFHSPGWNGTKGEICLLGLLPRRRILPWFWSFTSCLFKTFVQVFIGGGTGITPLMSMLREAALKPSTPVIIMKPPCFHQPSRHSCFRFYSLMILFTAVNSLCRPSSSTAPPTPTSTLSKRNSASSSTQTNTSLALVFVILTQTNKLHHFLDHFSSIEG